MKKKFFALLLIFGATFLYTYNNYESATIAYAETMDGTNGGQGGGNTAGDVAQGTIDPDKLDAAVKAVNTNQASEEQKRLVDQALNEGILSGSTSKGTLKYNNAHTTNGFSSIISYAFVSDPKLSKEEGGLLGKGGVQADVPYSLLRRVSKQNDFTKAGGSDKAGRQMTYNLVTMSHYGYYNTTNTVADQDIGVGNRFMRLIGGVIGSILLFIEQAASWLRETFVKVFLQFNFANLLSGKGNDSDNVIVAAFKNLLDAMGINSDLFANLAALGFTLLSGMAVFKMIKGIGTAQNVQAAFRNVSEEGKRWIVRVITIVAVLPISAILMQTAMQTAWSVYHGSKADQVTVSKYLVNTKLWAETMNLAPDAGTGSKTSPDYNKASTTPFVDLDFSPSISRDYIGSINSNAYKIANENGNYSNFDEKSLGYDLLATWLSGETFTVNDYTSNMQTLNGQNSKVYASVVDKGSLGKDTDKWTDFDKYIWGAKQNVTGDDRYANKFYDGHGITSLNAGAPAGTNALNTQSVAILLQSNLNENRMKFYAQNVAPSGVQATFALPSAHPAWYSVSLVGGSGLGAFGSIMEMYAVLLVKAILTLFAALMLFRIGLIDNLKLTLKRAVQAVGFGRVEGAVGFFALLMGLVGTAVFVLFVPDLLADFITSCGNVLVNTFTQGNLDGAAQIVNIIVLAAMTYFLLKERGNEVPLFELLSIPMTWSKDFDSFAQRAFRFDSGSRFTNMPGITGVGGDMTMSDIRRQQLIEDKLLGNDDTKSDDKQPKFNDYDDNGNPISQNDDPSNVIGGGHVVNDMDDNNPGRTNYSELHEAVSDNEGDPEFDKEGNVINEGDENRQDDFVTKKIGENGEVLDQQKGVHEAGQAEDENGTPMYYQGTDVVDNDIQHRFGYEEPVDIDDNSDVDNDVNQELEEGDTKQVDDTDVSVEGDEQNIQAGRDEGLDDNELDSDVESPEEEEDTWKNTPAPLFATKDGDKELDIEPENTKDVDDSSIGEDVAGEDGDKSDDNQPDAEVESENTKDVDDGTITEDVAAEDGNESGDNRSGADVDSENVNDVDDGTITEDVAAEDGDGSDDNQSGADVETENTKDVDDGTITEDVAAEDGDESDDNQPDADVESENNNDVDDGTITEDVAKDGSVEPTDVETEPTNTEDSDDDTVGRDVAEDDSVETTDGEAELINSEDGAITDDVAEGSRVETTDSETGLTDTDYSGNAKNGEDKEDLDTRTLKATGIDSEKAQHGDPIVDATGHNTHDNVEDGRGENNYSNSLNAGAQNPAALSETVSINSDANEGGTSYANQQSSPRESYGNPGITDEEANYESGHSASKLSSTTTNGHINYPDTPSPDGRKAIQNNEIGSNSLRASKSFREWKNDGLKDKSLNKMADGIADTRDTVKSNRILNGATNNPLTRAVGKELRRGKVMGNVLQQKDNLADWAEKRTDIDQLTNGQQKKKLRNKERDEALKRIKERRERRRKERETK